jgi:soluble lytic murein transglycosylase-like protein
MLPLRFQGLIALCNLSVRFCLILVIAMPAYAASPERSATVVRADQKSGRLVRSVVQVVSIPVSPVSVSPLTLEPKTAASPGLVPEPQADASSLVALVDRIAGENGVEGSLVHSVIRAESNYNTRAVSPKGAQGVMQLIPATARRFGVTNTFDPKDNIQGGVRYLKFLLDYYSNDYVKAIAAYNAGEGAVDKYHGIPPFPETQNYVIRVAKNLKVARQARSQETASPANVLLASANVGTYQPIRTSVGEDGRVYYRTP